MNSKMATYWPDEAQRLAAENRYLRDAVHQRDRSIRRYQALSILAVIGCILLLMGV